LWMATESGIVLDSVDNAAVYEVVGDDRSRHLQDNTDLGIIVYDNDWRSVAVPAETA
jgi:hypothetical protein